jgi:acyl-CoA thioesterase-1
MSVMSTTGQTTTQVSYPDPTVSGGQAPLSYKCSPPTSSPFTVGTTSVKCQVTDAQQRAESCSFAVTVVLPPPPIPRLSLTNFVSFGDSMTAGDAVIEGLSVPLSIPSPAGSYPADLLTLLTGRYPMQGLVVLDEGVSGETVAQGMSRLPRVLTSDRPGVVLLFEGVNDLNQSGAAAIPTVASGLQSMVRTARGNGAVVFLGTLLPQRPGLPRAYSPTLVEPMNDRIRSLAPAEGALLVDLYRDFAGQANTLIGSDGLHPNAAGYRQIATSFFNAIRSQLEVTQQPSSPNVVVQGGAVRLTPSAVTLRSSPAAH